MPYIILYLSHKLNWTADKDVNMKAIFAVMDTTKAVYFYSFILFVYSPLHGFNWNQHSDQLAVGLLAQLVEHCTGITEVMGSNPVQAWIFFRPSFYYCLVVVFIAAKIAFIFMYWYSQSAQCWRITRLWRDSVRLMNERQSLHDSQHKLVCGNFLEL